MQRYFGSVLGKSVLLKDDDVHHLLKVMRAKIGDNIEVVSDGVAFMAQVKNLRPLQIEIISKIEEKRELPIDIILIASLLKGDKIDFVVQKACELGVSEIVLLNTSRVIVRKDDYCSEKKFIRYNKILKEASEQCHRNKIPLLYRAIDIKDIQTIKADVKLIAYEDNAGSTKSFLSEVRKIEKGQKVAILIGPEGGFSSQEVALCKDNGYSTVSLGRRILRAETASIYALSVISCLSDK
ncbi:MAG TPA: 16S rRNA (uracil(1498)-N(3))-methyltransferase [Firmicutes bacterium]|nr:16S rRNA (uracil(1498)-N(3))-methyltransferase [Bacillota bacterium]